MTVRDADDATIAASPAPGDSVGGRYQLVRVVGRGGMGVVWEATNTWTDRRVAIKFMGAGTAANGRTTARPDQVDRFLREAKATARVRHPHVVEVLDMGNDPERGGLFIVYDFLDGESLRAVLERRGVLSCDEATALLVPTMHGVAAAHRCGVVHRDLKPENILLASESGNRVVPRVIDFGVAKLAETEASEPSITHSGIAVGTADYMSPEQCRGAADIDERTDVWALGVIWFEALSGRLPHEGGGYNQVMAAVLMVDALPLASVRPDVPAPLAAAIDRALARDREARHPTVLAFLDAISAATGVRPVSPAVAPARASRTRVWIVAAIASVLLAAVALGINARRESPTAVRAAIMRAPEAPPAIHTSAPVTPPSSETVPLPSPPQETQPAIERPAASDSPGVATSVTRARISQSQLPTHRRTNATVSRRPAPATSPAVTTPTAPTAPTAPRAPPARAPNGAPVLDP